MGRLDGAAADGGQLGEMLRILHTLKGGARLAGQAGLGNLAHDLEQRLTEAQQQGAPWADSLHLDVQRGYEALQKAVDQLKEVLASDGETASAAERTEPAVVAQLPRPIVAASAAGDLANHTPAKVLPSFDVPSRQPRTPLRAGHRRR